MAEPGFKAPKLCCYPQLVGILSWVETCLSRKILGSLRVGMCYRIFCTLPAFQHSTVHMVTLGIHLLIHLLLLIHSDPEEGFKECSREIFSCPGLTNLCVLEKGTGRESNVRKEYRWVTGGEYCLLRRNSSLSWRTSFPAGAPTPPSVSSSEDTD